MWRGPEALIGRRVDRYEIVSVLGKGGQGAVFAAKDLQASPAEPTLVALKLPLDRADAERFAQEARTLKALQHPRIVRWLADGHDPDLGADFLATELLEGESLDDRVASGPMPVADVIEVGLQVCEALACAHANAVIHRDLKPQNVMVGAFGEVLVLDWGLAKVLTDAPAPSATEDATEIRAGRDSGLATQAGAVMGTPAYMSPEQAAGEIEKVDERSDVFGLGAMLCVVLTGKPPYQGPTADVVRIQAIRGDTADAFARLDGCGADGELIALCKRCLAADRGTRPRSADEVAKAVAAQLAAVEERARQAELERVRAEERRKQRRVQWVLAFAVLLLLAVAATGATVVRLWRAAETARAEAVEQHGIAENGRREAERLRGVAERAQGNESEARDKLAVFEYGRTMQVAHQEWRDNNVVGARSSTRPIRSCGTGSGST